MKIASFFIPAAFATEQRIKLSKIRFHADDLLYKADNNPRVPDKDIARAHMWVSKIFDQTVWVDTVFPCSCATTWVGTVADDFDYEYCEKVDKVATSLTSWLDIYECYCGSGKSPGEKIAKRTRRMTKVLKRIAKCPK